MDHTRIVTEITPPQEWDAPEFTFGQTMYLAGVDRQYTITGMRYHMYSRYWTYLLAYQWANGWSEDGREYEAGDLSATPWCEFAGLCGRVATTEVQAFTELMREPYTLRLCAECAADEVCR